MGFDFKTHQTSSYDALALALVADDLKNKDFDLTVFDSQDDSILLAAQALAKIRHGKHLFTDLGGFTLRCDQCKKALTGEKEATEHAMRTGHSQFVEYTA